MQQIYFDIPPPFHMYNLPKLETCSKPCQTPRVYLFVITVFNGFKSLIICLTVLWIRLCKMLCIKNIMFIRNFHSHLHMLHLHFGPGHVLMNFLDSNDEVIDLISWQYVPYVCTKNPSTLISKLYCILRMDVKIMLFMSNIWWVMKYIFHKNWILII